MLLRRPRVQGDRGHAFLFGNLTRADEGEQIVVDAHPELGRHRNAVRRCPGNDRPQNRAQQVGLERHCRAATPASDLLSRTTKVEVDVIDPILRAEATNRFADDVGIAAVELQAARGLVGGEGGHTGGFGVAMNERRGHHHFVHVHEVGCEPPAHRTKWRVRDAGHWRKHNGRPDLEATQLQRFHPENATRTNRTASPPLLVANESSNSRLNEAMLDAGAIAANRSALPRAR